MSDSPNQEQLTGALRRLGATADLAEAHGVLVGLVCAQGTVEREQWLAILVPERDPNDLLAAESMAALGALYDETLRQLGSTLLEFTPLLPDDELAMGARVDALGEWCQGFLMGITLGGVDKVEEMPGDSGEILRDLVQLGRAGSYELDDDEEDEHAYWELVEYLRSAVLLLNEELNPTKAAPRMTETLH